MKNKIIKLGKEMSSTENRITSELLKINKTHQIFNELYLYHIIGDYALQKIDLKTIS